MINNEDDHMTTLLVAKQYIKNFIGKYEVYLKPLMKLILALVSLMMINGKIGYMHRLDNISIVLIVSLMCSFFPILHALSFWLLVLRLHLVLLIHLLQ